MAGRVGRLVLNHSSNLPGLLPVLESLAATGAVQTLIPGRIAKSRGHRPNFSLRVTVPVQQGFKLLARKDRTAQEVFVVTDRSREEVEALVAAALGAGGRGRGR